MIDEDKRHIQICEEVDSLIKKIEHSIKIILNDIVQNADSAFGTMMSSIMYQGRYGAGISDSIEYALEIRGYLQSFAVFSDLAVSHKQGLLKVSKDYNGDRSRKKCEFDVIGECELLFFKKDNLVSEFILDECKELTKDDLVILTVGQFTAPLIDHLWSLKRKEFLKNLFCTE